MFKNNCLIPLHLVISLTFLGCCEVLGISHYACYENLISILTRTEQMKLLYTASKNYSK